ncbi:DUF1304 domain-containing protein [Ensifer sp. B1-9]|uniref:DUF1304 domain-containing protein n=1 Tax=Ensifer sp. B1-9 TaxID=3141455 RepID=UPI003D22698B
MAIIANSLIALTGLLHVGFLVFEMFLWTGPRGRAVFRMTPQQAETTRVLAANQGPAFAFELKVFFLVCVIVAAIYGAWSVKPRILLIQGGPAITALLFVLMAS